MPCYCVLVSGLCLKRQFLPKPPTDFQATYFLLQTHQPCSFLGKKIGREKEPWGEGLGSRPCSPHSSCVTLGKWPNLSELFPYWMMRRPTLPLWSLCEVILTYWLGKWFENSKFSLRGATALLLLMTLHLHLPSYTGGLEAVRGPQRGSQNGQETKYFL